MYTIDDVVLHAIENGTIIVDDNPDGRIYPVAIIVWSYSGEYDFITINYNQYLIMEHINYVDIDRKSEFQYPHNKQYIVLNREYVNKLENRINRR